MSVQCNLCFHHCNLDTGQTGLCRARANREGKIVPLNYGKLTALALDPIEKKPLRRFHPGSWVLSVGSFGCNLRCLFCQNAEIAAAGVDTPTQDCSPEALVHKAVRLQARGNIGVAYTYNEPLVGYEYVRDCAMLVHEAGLRNILVTNGTIEEEPWRALSAWLSAVRPDIPLHISRFFPRHRMANRPPTPVETIYRLADVAREQLRYVYTGNC